VHAGNVALNQSEKNKVFYLGFLHKEKEMSSKRVNEK